MGTFSINGLDYRQLIINGYHNLSNDVERINSLNVFPVPDGDTGTNMKKTMEGGYNAVLSLKETNIGKVAKDTSRGMTFSARGNSGVILSQFFKGLSLAIADKDVVDVDTFAAAMLAGVAQAYVVVNNPTEGTILTVMREASQVAHDSHVEDFETYFKVFLEEANASLARTPELLPILKKAGVIDSGGAGFIRIIEGMALSIDGTVLEKNSDAQIENAPIINSNSFNADSVLEYGYCTEFILQLQNAKVDIQNFNLEIITDYLKTKGDSIVAFKDDDIVKVHVHTFTPGEVINYCQQFGEYVTFKMENMSVQHSENSFEPEEDVKEHKEVAYVAVSSGEGITDLFEEMGIDVIIKGGQTMNPSTQDFIDAFHKIDADNIFVFPNNGNIIMAALQAAENYKDSNVIVIKTRSIAECYSAASLIEDTNDIEYLKSNFETAMNHVVSCELTHAVRDCTINNFEIKKDDYMAFVGRTLASVNKNRKKALLEIFDQLGDIDEKEVVTIFVGKGVEEDEVSEIVSKLQEKFSWLEIGVILGKQDIYNYLIAIE